MSETRPALTADITSAELLRWYWLKDEWARFARTLKISSAGGKQELTARIVARLDGRAPSPRAARRPPPAAALPEPVTDATRIPASQRCTQQLRRYFVRRIGTGFRFDAAMRGFLATGEAARWAKPSSTGLPPGPPRAPRSVTSSS